MAIASSPFGGAGDSMELGMLDDASEAASLEDRGELFEYRIAQPITLPRGGSALVPLLAARAEASRERIWRAGSPPAPDLVIAFSNSTGAVLEEGPAVVYDEGVYAGEAMVPYSARGTEVKLAFAKDLAVRCKRDVTTRWYQAGLELKDRFVVEEQRVEDRNVLRADSDHDEEIEVVFEIPRRADRSISSEHGVRPTEETASFRRFRAKVPPHGKVEVEVYEVGVGSRRIEYASLTPAQLDHWLREGALGPGPLREGLAEVVRAWAESAALEARATGLEQQKNAVHAGQSRIAEQLKVLREAGPEGELRLRYVGELAQAQDRVAALDREIAAAREGALAARSRAEQRLHELLANVR
jgi:hypothetical protein